MKKFAVHYKTVAGKTSKVTVSARDADEAAAKFRAKKAGKFQYVKYVSEVYTVSCPRCGASWTSVRTYDNETCTKCGYDWEPNND